MHDETLQCNTIWYTYTATTHKDQHKTDGHNQVANQWDGGWWVDTGPKSKI